MEMNNKTHYRKVFKSDHLGVADLEDLVESGADMVFTIRRVKQEIGVRVAGKKGNHNIAYFEENIKPLCLNAGNSKILKKLSGGSSFVEDWKGLTVRLYIDPTASFAGEITGGVRINPNPVRLKTALQPNTKSWNRAVDAYKRDGNLEAVLSKINVSADDQKLIIEQANVA